MMHDRADTNDAFPRIFRFAIPDPPTLSLDFGDDHSLRRHSREIAGRQRAGDLLEMFKPHSNLLVAGFSDRSNSAVRRRNGGFPCRIWAPTVRREVTAQVAGPVKRPADRRSCAPAH